MAEPSASAGAVPVALASAAAPRPSRVMSAFTPLRVHSHGSLLHGVASPQALVARALELGYDTLALADRDNLYLGVAFYRHARTEGLRPLLGATVHGDAGEALLVAIDRRGYAHLCEILTRRHLDERFDLAAAIAASHAGLHVIVESTALAAALRDAGVPAADGAAAGGARPPRQAGGLWIGVRGIGAERVRAAARLAAARRLGIPPVATGDCVLLTPADHDAHRAAVTAAAGELLDRMTPGAFCARDAWLAAPAEWERRIRAVCAAAGAPAAADEALANNRALAARCRLELDLGTPIFPHVPLPDGVSGRAWLRRLGADGVRRRYRAAARVPAQRRLDSELEMIERLGFTDYFLLVAEIVEFARARGIPSVGRGSGASSMVAYALGITNVDPLGYGLTFERFLNPGRKDCPDLDIDLCWKRRDEVIRHVYDTYGADRVVMISTHATLGARSAFRETAKALGVPNPRVNALARRIPRDLEPPYAERLAAMPEGRGVDWREPMLARALALAERLDGAPRHLSVHSGGVVVADRPLTAYVPLERAAKGVVVTQFEMRAIEAIGLVKMDLLGNRALTTIDECVSLVRRHRGVAIEPDSIPDGDAAAGTRIAAGDTLNCFQLESPAMRHLLRMLEARTLEDTIAAVAAVRPGPAEMGLKEAFCRRKRGLEPVAYHHLRLEPVLRGTCGVMLYEEDVMRVAAAIAGLTLAEGDDLRRAIGAARGEDEFRSLERGFVAQAVRNGVDLDSARAVWRDLTRFAAYAFCKAHAAGYGRLGYESAWLKTHFPTEWAVGVLNHHAGMYSTWVHVEDLRRHGVVFRGPCTRRSAWESTLEPAEDGAGEDGAGAEDGARDTSAAVRVGLGRVAGRDTSAAVRVGLGRVAGLSQSTAARIAAARDERPFASLADFTARARPALPELETLVLAGALDWTGRTRPSLLLEARVTAARAGAPARGRAPAGERVLVAADGTTVLPDPVAPVDLPELSEFDAPEHVRGECRATGLWFSAHPLDVWVGAEALRGATPAAELERRVGRTATLVGLPCAWRRLETRSGETMLFLSLADRSGVAECVLFPDAYRRWAGALRGAVLSVAGRVGETLGAVALEVNTVRTLAEGDGRAPDAADPQASNFG